MKHIPNLLKALTVFLVLPAGACELHDNMNFGIFGSLPGKMQFHMSKAAPAYLEVSHLRRMAVESGANNTINVKYTLPLEYRDITIEFLPTDNVEVISEVKIKPSDIRGSYALNFTANGPGQHEILVAVAAKKQGQPFTQEQKIAITAF